MTNNHPAFSVGDIVLAHFPFADHSVTKLRPAILVSALPQDAWLVIYVTSASEQTTYDVVLQPTQTNNLKVVSVARTNRMTVVSRDMIDRTLGCLTKSERTTIAKKIVQISKEFTG